MVRNARQAHASAYTSDVHYARGDVDEIDVVAREPRQASQNTAAKQAADYEPRCPRSDRALSY